MTESDVLKNAFAMPLMNPAYPRGPVRFVNREFVIITYRTDPDALARVVPAPLMPAEPIVKYEFINMPDSTGLGSYSESGQVIPVTFNGEAGGYTHGMYVNDFAAIASGREWMGYPKLLASPKLEVRRDCLVGTLDYNGIRLATATMAYKYKAMDLKAVEKSMQTPGFLLKIIPHIDGSPRICEIVKFRLSDLVIKGAWSGPASLELHPHALAPVADLPVREVISAMHLVADLSLGSAEIAYDYLARETNTDKLLHAVGAPRRERHSPRPQHR